MIVPPHQTVADVSQSGRMRALGAFLRARRDALSPASVGLENMMGRRRAPGLRREEAAQLCGISTTWYTWLEQGRRVSCSAATLGRIATALRLSAAERVYLFELAQLVDPCGAGSVLHDSVPEPVSAFPHFLDIPAYVLDLTWTICGCNPAARRLFGEWIADKDANLLRFVFLSAEARDFLDDWESSARRILAEFRAGSVHEQGGASGRLVQELLERSADFARLWHDQRVLGREGGRRRFHPPEARKKGGCRDFEQTTLGFASWPRYQAVVLRPLQFL